MSKPSAPSQTDETPRTVQIPAPTATAIAKRLEGTEFDSVDEYVAFALDQLLYELERDDEISDHRGDDPDPPEAPDDDERVAGDDEVSDRLESLGYL